MARKKAITERKRKRVEAWLIKSEGRINISQIEKDMGLPKNKIQRFIKYGRVLKDEEIIQIDSYVYKCMKSFLDIN